jgi:hypothetical protein
LFTAGLREMRRTLLTMTLLGACAHAPVPKLDSTVSLCGAGPEPCLPADTIERRLDGPLTVRDVRPVGSGLSKPILLTVELDGRQVRLKWKASARGGDGHNRSPRHELAAWVMSRLIAGESEEVVPPTVLRCLTPDEQRRLFGRAAPATFRGIDCTLGTLSLWLEDVDVMHGLDEQRFRRDREYRAAIARLNLVTYVVDHRDGKDANFLVTRGEPVRAFAVDNGVAFSGFRTARGWFVPDWSHLKVHAVPRDALDRLRAMGPAELEKLAVLAQLEVRDGRLVRVPAGPPLPGDGGVRRFGDTIQIGLSKEEIAAVSRRIAHLLALAETGQLATF